MTSPDPSPYRQGPAVPQSAEALEDEWSRAQRAGRRVVRARLAATLAGMAPVAVGFAGSVLVYWLWPLDGVPIWCLVIPIALSLPIGWRARNKLWPRGQFR